jgi:hypothetical protein
VINHLLELSEKAVEKAGSSSRYVFVYKIMICCYNLSRVGGAAFEIAEHTAKRYIINSVDPKYNICWFVALAKYQYPELKGNPLLARGRELFFRIYANELIHFKAKNKTKNGHHLDNDFVEQYEGF